MKKEILSIIVAIFMASLFIVILAILVIINILVMEDIRAEITGLIVNVIIIGALVWGFKPALKMLFFGKQPKMSNQQLKTQSTQLTNDIGLFIGERRTNEPQIDFDRWNETTDMMIKYSVQSVSLCHVKFDQRLADVWEEFLIRKIYDEEFERYYTQPTNYIGMEIVGQRLATMAAKL
jgi:hypothetical protein